MVNQALFGLGMRVEKANKLFRELCLRVFRGRNRFGIGLPAAVHALIVSYRNGQFPAADIDGALSEIFGDATMLDHPYMTSIGARIGFPVVNVHSKKTCIVTSYNGIGQRPSRDDCKDEPLYKVLCSNEPGDEILVRDA
jgi:hypothetical protein